MILGICLLGNNLFAQGPEVTSWLQNTTQNGTYYISGNSTPIDLGILFNCQEVSYSTDYVYIKTHGIPAYPSGPFLDGNPSIAEDQNAIFRFPRNPAVENGPKTPTTMGNIGVFINGTALFDNRDGVAWNSGTSSLCGGPEILHVLEDQPQLCRGIVMLFKPKNRGLIVQRDTRLWEIITIIRILRLLSWI